MDKVHGCRANTNHVYGCLEQPIGKKLIWKMVSDNSICYRVNVVVCPVPGCKYMSSSLKALVSHVEHSHRSFDEERNEIGWFWSTILAHVKVHNRIPTCMDILRPRDGFICSRCNLCWSSDPKGIKSHAKKEHADATTEGTRMFHSRITCTSIVNLSLDEDTSSRIARDINLYRDARLANRIVIDQERNNLIEEEGIPNPSQIDAARLRRTREDNRRIRLLRDQQLRNLFQGLDHNGETSTAPEERTSIPDETPNNDITADDISRLSNLSREALLHVAQTWSAVCNEMEEHILSLPKSWGANKKKLSASIPSLFEDKITPLIDVCEPKNERPDDENFYILEGCLAKINMMIRKEIQDTLKISDNMMLNRRRLVVRDNTGVDDVRSLESDVHLMSKFAFKLQKMFNLHKKIKKSQKLHNLYNVLMEDVMKAFPRLPL